MFLPLYPPGERASRYRMNTRLGGPQSHSPRCGEEKRNLSQPEIEPGPSSPYRVTIPTELYYMCILNACLQPVSCLVFSSTVKMEATYSSERPADFHYAALYLRTYIHIVHIFSFHVFLFILRRPITYCSV
jgi:hypothetical protein